MSHIQWTEKTWNPTIGCSKASEGCKNCYAIKEAWIRSHNPNPAIQQKFAGTVYKTEGGVLNWTGNINIGMDALTLPLQRKSPTLWFVNSMSDLFHPNMPEEYIDEVYAVMALCRQHTFQVLTKHPDRMVEYFKGGWRFRVSAKVSKLLNGDGLKMHGMTQHELDVLNNDHLPNVWHGVSVENQKWADERIPLLLCVPSAVRFLSCEPLLGMVELHLDWHMPISLLDALTKDPNEYETVGSHIHWVICGGESGPDARPMHPTWAQSLRNQCDAAGIPFFFKQWGEWAPQEHWKDNLVRNKLYMWPDGVTEVDVYTRNGVGGQIMGKVGKKKAGELLDFKEYKEWPKVFTPTPKGAKI